MQYVCTRKCFFQDRLFQEGEKVDFAEDVKVPIHFAVTDEKVVAQKEEVKKEADVEEKRLVEQLRSEFDKIGKAYDGRWGSEKLELMLRQAKKGM